MDILESDYPNMVHLLIFDNAPNHLKRPEDALSARKMPKFTPAPGNNWGIEVSKRDANGKVEHGLNGKPIKIKIKMRDTFHNSNLKRHCTRACILSRATHVQGFSKAWLSF